MVSRLSNLPVLCVRKGTPLGWKRIRTRRILSTRFASEEGTEERTKVEFGYTRKDVILIGVGMGLGGVGLYQGLQTFAGMDALRAGNYVQITFVLGIMLFWASTYVSRVLNKDMTYVQQLKDYEEQVMKKRLEEMTEEEREALLEEVEAEKEARRKRRS